MIWMLYLAISLACIWMIYLYLHCIISSLKLLGLPRSDDMVYNPLIYSINILLRSWFSKINYCKNKGCPRGELYRSLFFCGQSNKSNLWFLFLLIFPLHVAVTVLRSMVSCGPIINGLYVIFVSFFWACVSLQKSCTWHWRYIYIQYSILSSETG